MSHAIIMKFIAEAKESMLEVAECSMMHPQSDIFEHGVSCGRYQGLHEALELLHGILKGDEDEDDKL